MNNVYSLKDYDKLENRIENQLSNDGYDGGEPPMEARIAKLESNVEYIQRDIGELKSDIKDIKGDINSIRTTDFRITFGAIIVVALGLAGLMAKGFGWI